VWEGREVVDSNGLFSRAPEIVQSCRRGGVERSGKDRSASFPGEDYSPRGGIEKEEGGGLVWISSLLKWAWGLLVGDKRRFGMMGTTYGWARSLFFWPAEFRGIWPAFCSTGFENFSFSLDTSNCSICIYVVEMVMFRSIDLV
jgi:hypothetical protein